jgi:hypothetical protein
LSVFSSLQQFQLCGGIPVEESFNLIAVDPSSDCCFGNIVRHTVPLNLESYDDNGLLFQARVFLRSYDCEVLCEGDKCADCEMKGKFMQKSFEKKAAKEAHKVPIHQQRVVCKQLEERISELEIEKKNTTVSPLMNLLKKIFWRYLQTTPHDYLPI